MMKGSRRIMIAKPWIEVVRELMKEGCRVEKVKQDRAVL
jgi:hypothetical protein